MRLHILIVLIFIPSLCHSQGIKELEKKADQELSAGAFRKARILLLRAQKIALRDHLLDSTIAKLKTSIGTTYISEGYFDSAMHIFKNSILLFKSKYPESLQIPRLYNSISNAFEGLGKIDSALVYNNKAIVFAKNSKYLPDYYNNRSGIFYKANVIDSSMYYDKKALSIFKTLNARQKIVRAYHHIAQNFERLNNLDSSLYYYQGAVKAQPSNPLTLFVIHRGIAMNYKKRNQFKFSLKSFLKSDSILKSVRRNLGRQAEKIGLLRAKKHLINDALEVCYSLYTQAPEKYFSAIFYFSERYKANTLLDQEGKSIISIDSLQRKLPSRLILVEYIQTKRHLYILTLKQGQQVGIVKRVDINRGELYKLVREYNLCLQAIQLYKFHRLNYRLYSLLIKPIIATLVNVDRLVIIPTTELLNMPFESLILGKSNDYKTAPYLLKRYLVNYHVSATLVVQKSKPRVYSKSFVGFAPVTFKGKINSLFYSKKEVLDASKAFISNKVFLHEHANIQNLKNTDSKFLHIATHGFYNNKRLTGVFLSDSTLTSSRVNELNINAEYVILSGCETGLGALNQYEGFTTGFVRSLLSNGSKGVLSVIWRVQDKVSSLFFKEFYASYQANKDVSKAVRIAKLKLLNHGKGYAFPYWWTGYRFIAGVE